MKMRLLIALGVIILLVIIIGKGEELGRRKQCNWMGLSVYAMDADVAFFFFLSFSTL